MKRFILFVCCSIFIFSSFAQPTSILAATDKTVSLIFPFSIKHVDRGSKDVLVQPVKEADNILLVKAAQPGFNETNLVVITSDGAVYTFSVNYNAKPETYVYYLPLTSKTNVATYCNNALDNPPFMSQLRDRSWDVTLRVTGIYVKNEVMYYQVEIDNRSSIDYSIELLRFFIRDKKRTKRTASQEIELKPLYIAGNTALVRSASKCIAVIALEKFTIPDAKFLGVQLIERNGGRHLHLRLQNRSLLQARTLPDLQ